MIYVYVHGAGKSDNITDAVDVCKQCGVAWVHGTDHWGRPEVYAYPDNKADAEALVGLLWPLGFINARVGDLTAN